MIAYLIGGLTVIVILLVILAYELGHRRGYESAVLTMLIAHEAAEVSERVAGKAFRDIWHGNPSADSVFPGLDGVIAQAFEVSLGPRDYQAEKLDEELGKKFDGLNGFAREEE